jgi:hypothetical protein
VQVVGTLRAAPDEVAGNRSTSLLHGDSLAAGEKLR